MDMSSTFLWIAAVGNSAFICYLFYRMYIVEGCIEMIFDPARDKEFMERFHEVRELVVDLKTELYKLQKELETYRKQ